MIFLVKENRKNQFKKRKNKKRIILRRIFCFFRTDIFSSSQRSKTAPEALKKSPAFRCSAFRLHRCATAPPQLQSGVGSSSAQKKQRPSRKSKMTAAFLTTSGRAARSVRKVI